MSRRFVQRSMRARRRLKGSAASSQRTSSPAPAKACCRSCLNRRLVIDGHLEFSYSLARMASRKPTRGEEQTMSDRKRSRREFFGASAGITAVVASALADPPHAASQSAGVKPGDLPDLTIKEVKVYVADLSNFRRLNGSETGEIVSVVTNGGHEGNYTIGNRSLTPNWLEWAKPALLGNNVIDLLPTITATTGTRETFGFSGDRSGGPGGGRGEIGRASCR